MKITIDEFCNICNITNQKKKIDAVILLIWYHQHKTNSISITIKEINQYLTLAHLPEYNKSRLASDLKSDRRITKGGNNIGFKLNRSELENLDKKFSYLFNSEIEIKERINLNSIPFLVQKNIEDAHNMSQLYLIIHCFENSVRNFILHVLNKNLGINWWDNIKNSGLEKKVEERKDKELKQKWISQRGNDSPLFYLDWSDLIKIIRKSEDLFLPLITDLKFIELRFEELERVRNIIAHNGCIPEQNDIDRLVLYVQDWIKQINEVEIKQLVKV